MTNLGGRSRCIGIAAAIAAVFSLTGAAQAVTDSVFKYSAQKIGSYSISVVEMSPQSYGNVFSIDFFHGRLYGGGCYTTGVHLPQGAKITFLTVYYRGGNNGNLAFYLLRTRVSDGRVDRLVSRVIQDNSSTRKNDSNGVASQVATMASGRGFAVQWAPSARSGRCPRLLTRHPNIPASR